MIQRNLFTIRNSAEWDVSQLFIDIEKISTESELREKISNFWRSEKLQLFLECSLSTLSMRHIYHIVNICQQEDNLNYKKDIFIIASAGTDWISSDF